MSTEPQVPPTPQVNIPEPPVVVATAESEINSHVEQWMHWVEEAIAKLRQHVTVLVGGSSDPASSAPADPQPAPADAVQPPATE